jgi:ArsR family metal-binding transcriptional regulator
MMQTNAEEKERERAREREEESDRAVNDALNKELEEAALREEIRVSLMPLYS